MAYDHEEQEQIESIKAWWRQYGNIITWLLIIVLAGFGGWQLWNKYHSKQTEQAAELFAEQQKAVELNDQARVLRVATDIQDQYARTAYAQMSALIAAKSALQTNDLVAAKKQFEWVLNNGQDDEFKAIAAVRLAGILLDEKDYEGALKALDGKFPAPFDTVIADRKGDIYLAQEKVEDARKQFSVALEKALPKDPARQLIQLKLDGIGGATKEASK
jgi:predicted negative regulator of RcsB-dependent stress response